MIPLESFYPSAEGLRWSRSILGQNDSSVVVLSQDRRTPITAVITIQDGLTPLESFYPRTE